MSLFCGLFEPAESLGRILRDIFSIEVPAAKFKLCIDIALLRRFLQLPEVVGICSTYLHAESQNRHQG